MASDEDRRCGSVCLLNCTKCVRGDYAAGGSGNSDGTVPLWAATAAELVATALLVALSCLAPCAAPDASPLHASITSGLIVTLLVQCFDHLCGAMMNPTVTLAAVLRGRITARVGAAYAAAQLLGAAAAPALTALVAPSALTALTAPAHNLTSTAALCVTRPADGLPLYKAVCIEALLGGLLALANCASWDPRNRLLTDSWPLRIGTIVTVLTLLTGRLTGASINPARSFGPALWATDFTHHWVYWLGPLGGSALCSLLYAGLWHAPPAAVPRALPPPPPPPYSTEGDKRRPV
ncbi:unnamed protein product [Diatraea saccharalis]|uniref:Uncharacterized protein n=1 Tax=Diatraea saccharalis TaxID=40085 RepID=A0A9N9QVA1_9NEOP|nr:unnamed protein product [Diatraea saccharalis]